jgi:hypothetical protein
MVSELLNLFLINEMLHSAISQFRKFLEKDKVEEKKQPNSWVIKEIFSKYMHKNRANKVIFKISNILWRRQICWVTILKFLINLLSKNVKKIVKMKNEERTKCLRSPIFPIFKWTNIGWIRSSSIESSYSTFGRRTRTFRRTFGLSHRKVVRSISCRWWKWTVSCVVVLWHMLYSF